MGDIKHLVILVLMLINCSRCELKQHIHKRVEELNNKSKEMYGAVQDNDQDNVKNIFDLDKLTYPRGDKLRLSELSQAWRDYYSCSAGIIDTLSTPRMLPNIIMMVFQGAVARLPCSLCQQPGNADRLVWLYAKSTEKKEFFEVQNYDRMKVENGLMTIYNVIPEDEGVFWCKSNGSEGGVVILEVVDHEPYTVVKPLTSRGPHAVAPEIYQGIILYTKWTQWSECSVCGKVGRRHRYGVCYVKLDPNLIANYQNVLVTKKNNTLFELDDKLIELFQAFPEGLPCRSQYMPQTLRAVEALQQRSSEIMIGMCKVPCEDISNLTDRDNNATFEVSPDDSGTFIYSLTQELPKQPPSPTTNTLFADFGKPIAIRCPGTTLRDVPLLWRVGTKELVPRNVDYASRGRLHVNSRDHLVFTAVLYSDENLYSCWQRGQAAGAVRLAVWAGAPAHAAAGLLLLAALLLRLPARHALLCH